MKFTLDGLKKPIYLGSIGLLWLMYFLMFFGLFNINREYTRLFSIFIQIAICLFLIVRFNPFIKHELREFDGEIIFGSALLVLTNLGITEYILQFVRKETSIMLPNKN
jgi:hypothetical protein